MMQDRVLWLNDRFVSAGDARVSPLDRGLLYGDGLFETLRAEQGKALRLPRHLERLVRGLAFLRIPLQGLTEREWAPVIGALLVRNGLARQPASVRIIVTRGEIPGHGLPAPEKPTVMVLCDAYQPPTPDAYRSGWRLAPVPMDGAGMIGMHKTLSYLRLLAARQAAVDAGADEALLVDSEGACIETAAGSLLALVGDEWVKPEHPAQLAGITVETVAGFLSARGRPVATRAMTLRELQAARAAWVLGSLVGIMPVRSVGAVELPDRQAGLAEELRQELLTPPA